MAWSDLMQISYCKNVEIVAICDVDLNRTVEAREALSERAHLPGLARAARPRGKEHEFRQCLHARPHARADRRERHATRQARVRAETARAEIHEVRTMTAIGAAKPARHANGHPVHSSGSIAWPSGSSRTAPSARIREVHSWSGKNWGELSARPGRSTPCPRGSTGILAGGRADRPFIGDGYYHPGNWRRRIDFGTGTLGDMGCHMLDPVLESLGLSAPVSVRSEGPAPNQWNWAPDSKVVFTFASTPR